MKHNKKRNTAFIYEMLARALTKAIIDKNPIRKKETVSILKEFFGSGEILAKELSLYSALLGTRNIQQNIAERMLQETKVARNDLDNKQIFDAQSRIIASINKRLGAEVWSNFVPNFKSLASISAIFNKKTSVKKKVLFEQSIIDTMSAKQTLGEKTDLEPLDALAYNSFISKFNDKYGALLQEQKDLLNRFVTSFADEGFELRVYLNEELARLKTQVQQATESENKPLVLEKLDGVLEYLEEFRRREFVDNDLNKILKTQELIKELSVND
jgi:hypothetical protein